MAISDLTEYLAAAKSALDIFKGINSEMPTGPKAEQAEAQIQQAEKALRAAEAQLAKELGYKLCQCTFPPQIMLSQGRHPRYNEEIFMCSNCEKQEPSDGYFRNRDDVDAHNRGKRSGPTWTRRG